MSYERGRVREIMEFRREIVSETRFNVVYGSARDLKMTCHWGCAKVRLEEDRVEGVIAW